MILAIIGKLTSLKEVVSRCSAIELCLLKSTARYLLCNEISEEVDTIQSGYETKITKLRSERDALIKKYQDSKERNAIEYLNGQIVSKISCNAHRECRPQNKCGCYSLVIGELSIAGDKLKCKECINSTSYTVSPVLRLTGAGGLESEIRTLDESAKRQKLSREFSST